MPETAKITQTSGIWGNKLYEQRARVVFPILVRQAIARQTIFYHDLAKEVGMPNPRNLNYVLGTIANELKTLSVNKNIQIPFINAIVINQRDNLPGKGIDGFFQISNKASKREKEIFYSNKFNEIFDYNKWHEVLNDLKLSLPKIKNSSVTNSNHHGHGETEEHKNFKIYISKHPEFFKCKHDSHCEVEYTFPTMDSVDVLFIDDHKIVGVEVKSIISDEGDIERGLYQCLKYDVLLNAKNKVELLNKQVKVYLALESEFPGSLYPLKNILNVEFKDNLLIN